MHARDAQKLMKAANERLIKALQAALPQIFKHIDMSITHSADAGRPNYRFTLSALLGVGNLSDDHLTFLETEILNNYTEKGYEVVIEDTIGSISWAFFKVIIP